MIATATAIASLILTVLLIIWMGAYIAILVRALFFPATSWYTTHSLTITLVSVIVSIVVMLYLYGKRNKNNV
jgi:membrane protein implicated in regulation of membrane protease activity